MKSCIRFLSVLLYAGAGTAALADVQTNRWVRPAGGDPRASVASNWSLRHVPTAEEVVLFTARSARSAIWDAAAPHTVAGWVQESGYVAIVTFESGPNESFRTMTIDGDMELFGGALTHPVNGDSEKYWLSLDIRGNCHIGESARISASGKGYSPGKGPGAGLMSGGGASHGGQGAPKTQSVDVNRQTVYGSVLHPHESGSGGTAREGSPHGPNGGGVILMKVAGDLSVDGLIRADADSRDIDDANCGGASGGSIELQVHGRLKLGDKARIAANGGDGFHDGAGGGGGGRIAIYALSKEDVQNYASNSFYRDRIFASGGTGDTKFRKDPGKNRHVHGAGGTVYVQGIEQTVVPGSGRCVLTSWSHPSMAATCLPSNTGNLLELQDAEVIVSRNGYLSLGAPLQVRALGFLENGAADLNMTALIAGNVWMKTRDNKLDAMGIYRDSSVSAPLSPIFFNSGSVEIRPYFTPIVAPENSN